MSGYGFCRVCMHSVDTVPLYGHECCPKCSSIVDVEPDGRIAFDLIRDGNPQTPTEQRAWDLYCRETAGSMDARDFWTDLPKHVQARYIDRVSLFPEDSAERKTYPVFSGLLQYFPSALAAVAHHSYKGNEKHNPGQPLHHDRSKSGDEADALVRHVMEGDYVGAAWRALSLLQKDLEAKGAPIAPAARNAAPAFVQGPNLTPDEVESLRRMGPGIVVNQQDEE